MNEALLLKLVTQVYDASVDPGGWTRFLDAYSDAVGGGGIGLVRDPTGDDREIQAVAVGYDPAFLKSWHDHYYQLDPGREISRQFPAGRVGFDPVALTQRQRSEFYVDWLVPQGLGAARSFGVNVEVSEYGYTTLGVYPARGRRAPGADEAALTQALAPHIRRAFQVADLWRATEHERNALAETLDRVPAGIILIDTRRRVRRINHAASVILRQQDGLVIERGELRAASPALTTALHQRIEAACRTGEGGSPEATGALTLGRPSGQRPLEALVTPLGERARFSLEPDVVAAVFLRDPEQAPRLPGAVLRALYGFTPAETRLAQQLVAGRSPGEAAEALGISIGTIRNRLKLLFKKTGTHRQSDLVQLLTVGPAALAPIPRQTPRS